MNTSPQEREGDSDVVVVLVHGACHGAWCWEDVQGPLTEGGWTVKAPELPLTSLTDDANMVRQAVVDAKSAGSSVVLVAHSYGGVVISEAGHEADHLIYVAATMPDPGESASDLVPRLVPPELAAAFVVSDDGLRGSVDPDGAAAAFYNRCSRDQAVAATVRLRPMMLRCLQESVQRPAWMHVAASYVVCTDDRAMMPPYQRERAELLADRLVLETDHSPFYSATSQLVEWLDAISHRVAAAHTEAVPPASRV